jgi:hypothetical protein
MMLNAAAYGGVVKPEIAIESSKTLAGIATHSPQGSI